MFLIKIDSVYVVYAYGSVEVIPISRILLRSRRAV